MLAQVKMSLRNESHMSMIVVQGQRSGMFNLKPDLSSTTKCEQIHNNDLVTPKAGAKQELLSNKPASVC
jgi:hypothetical protein